MKKYILLVCCFFVGQFAYSQADSLLVRHRTILKTTPSFLFDFDNSITLGVEQFYRHNQSVQIEAGYGNSNWNLVRHLTIFGNTSNLDIYNYHIGRLRGEWRRYNYRDRKTLPEGGYIALETQLKYVGKRGLYEIGREVQNGWPQYFEYVNAYKRKYVGALHFKIGQQRYFSQDNPTKKPRFLLDFYAGLGLRVIDLRTIYDDDVAAPTSEGLWNRQPDMFGTTVSMNRTTPVISGTLGFKIGYLL